MRYSITATIEKDEKGANKSGFATTTYSKFLPRHPSYDPGYWERLECLYQGGKTLLENRSLMEKIFPPHRAEHEVIYAERLKCAHYLPFAGEIVGNTVMGTFSDPLEVSMSGNKELPKFYSEFVDDTSRPGKKTKCSFREFIAKMLLTALVKRTAWAQVDLPRVAGEFEDALAEEKAGAKRAYLVSIDPENVLDWEVDEDDDLLWAMTRKISNKRTSPDDDRSKITEEFTVFDREGFQVFEISYDEEKPPEPKDAVSLVDDGKHSFGQVPLKRLELPYGLWAMNKMEPAARALLRDLNSLEWAVRQSLHAELYEYLGSEAGGLLKPVGEAQEDARRAINQKRGQGHVQLRGKDDRAEYVGPPTEGFEFALKLVTLHRDEMHRVNNQSGVNNDVTASSKQQSAEAKREETASAENLYRETGKFVAEFAKDILQTVSEGRKETVEGILVTGMTKFNKRTTDGHLENALLVQGMMIESPTLDRKLKLDVAKVHMGEILSEEDLLIIEQELEENIVDESFDPTVLSPEEELLKAQMEEADAKDDAKDAKASEDDDGTWGDDDGE